MPTNLLIAYHDLKLKNCAVLPGLMGIYQHGGVENMKAVLKIGHNFKEQIDPQTLLQ